MVLVTLYLQYVDIVKHIPTEPSRENVNKYLRRCLCVLTPIGDLFQQN